MIKKFVLGGVGLLAVSQLISRALGVWRDHLFAQIFGATGGEGIFQIDAYYAAFRLPDLVYSLLIFGALSAAFVPLITELKERDRENQFASNVLNVLFVSVFVLSIIIFVLAEPLTRLITPGFDAEQITLTAQLLRIQLLAPLFFTLSAVFGGLAQHFHRFTWYALAPVLYNAGIIFGALVWAGEYGVYGLAWGTVLGAGLHAVIQLPGVLRNGFKWQPVFYPRQLRGLFALAGPRMLSVGASQLQLVAITIFASIIGAGALAVFSYAWNLASLPLGVVGVAYATVSFAALARVAGNHGEFFPLLQRNLLGVLFWAIPAATGLFVLREEITRLILAGGQFTEMDISLVAQSLAYLAPAIPFFTILPLLNNAFFAQKNTRVPLLAGLLALGTTILAAQLLATDYYSNSLASAYTFANTIGSKFLMNLLALVDANYYPNGLAIAYALAGVVSAGLLLFLLRKKLVLPILKPLTKILLAAAALGGLVLSTANLWEANSFGMLLAKVIVLSGLGASFYLATCKFFKITPSS